jgi:biotin carboxyl carrier protein
MKYVAVVQGRTFEIEVNTEGEVVVDGAELAVDFRPVSGPVYSLIVDGRSYEAYVNTLDEGMEVLMQGTYYLIKVEDERQKRLRESYAGVVTIKGEYQLKAPMPGLIVSVTVEVGQSVQQGDLLLILESMKMQNELKAPRQGVVSRVRVSAGDSVEQNQVLLTLE